MPYVASLSSLISAIDESSEADGLIIDLAAGSAEYGVILTTSDSWTYSEEVTSLGGVTRWHLYTLNYYPETQAYDKVEINLSSGEATLYRGTATTNTSVDFLQIVYSNPTYDRDGSLAQSVDVSVIDQPPAKYLDPSEGVTLSATQVSWTNQYTNAAIDIMLRVPNVGTTYNMEFVLDLNSGDDVTVGVSVDASGNVGVSITHGESTASVQAGKWRNFILSLDTRQGDYSLIPVTDFVSFYQYTALTDASYDLKLDLKNRTISGMTITSSGASLSMGIVQTSVFLDTYDVVMVDPSLDPAMYFTDLADMRLNFYSFALYGDSIEINSETYEVNDNAQIQVPVPDGKGGTIQTWTTLTNIYITFEQDHTYLTFVNDGLTVDLGETTDTTISFDGVWYFSAAIWEGYQTTETVMDWSPGDFFLDGNGAIIAFLGLLAVGTIVGARFVRGGMEALDYIVVAFAGLCGLVLLVVR